MEPPRKPQIIGLFVLKTTELEKQTNSHNLMQNQSSIGPKYSKYSEFVDPKPIDPVENKTQFFKVFSTQNRINEERVSHEELVDKELIPIEEEFEEDFYEEYKREFGMEIAHRKQLQSGGAGIYNQ